jgi:hypothetical protein
MRYATASTNSTRTASYGKTIRPSVGAIDHGGIDQRSDLAVHRLDVAADAACRLANGRRSGAAEGLQQVQALCSQDLPEQLGCRKTEASRLLGLRYRPGNAILGGCRQTGKPSECSAGARFGSYDVVDRPGQFAIDPRRDPAPHLSFQVTTALRARGPTATSVGLEAQDERQPGGDGRGEKKGDQGETGDEGRRHGWGYHRGDDGRPGQPIAASIASPATRRISTRA